MCNCRVHFYSWRILWFHIFSFILINTIISWIRRSKLQGNLTKEKDNTTNEYRFNNCMVLNFWSARKENPNTKKSCLFVQTSCCLLIKFDSHWPVQQKPYFTHQRLNEREKTEERWREHNLIAFHPPPLKRE